jgi:hypothetical protein
MDWSRTADMATTLALPVAAVSAGLALITYRAQAQAGADSHMHTLFREYLTSRTQPETHNDLGSLKLYALEEMVDWVFEQRRDLRAWGWLRPLSIRRRKAELNAWEATVESHLGDQPALVLDRVLKKRECYGTTFIDFLEKAAKRATGAKGAGSPQ